MEQEKRDRELALRLASEDQSQVEDLTTESKFIKQLLFISVYL